MKRIIKISLILLLVGMAVIAAVPFFKEKRTERKYENEFKNIQESVTEKKSDVNGLVKKNKDCIGYVEIPGTMTLVVLLILKLPDGVAKNW